MSVYPPGAPVGRAARISPGGQYRYALSRRWHANSPIATFVMLNPSTADADVDDPTIRRCVGFARALGCGGLVVVNLYALRATNPRDLRRADDPVGPSNDTYLARHAQAAAGAGAPLIAAWGTHAQLARVDAVLALPGMGLLQALGVTLAGHPRHPLYLPATAQLRPWPQAEAVPA